MRAESISNVGRIDHVASPVRPKAPGADFQTFVTSALNEVNKLQHQADDAAVRLAAGEVRDLHEVMIITEQANLALQLTMQVRNKVIDAYQEIMRMQV